MKRQGKLRKQLKVTVTSSEMIYPGARRHLGEIPSVDVTAIRQRAGLSQSAFASSIGVPEGTVRNWEQGRRQPSGPAKVLLALLAKRPHLVAELYPQSQPRIRWTPGCPDPNNMTAEKRLAEVGQILAIGILRMRSVGRGGPSRTQLGPLKPTVRRPRARAFGLQSHARPKQHCERRASANAALLRPNALLRLRLPDR
jgi:putative transcriptional regulator